jgi:hypothetical protein
MKHSDFLKKLTVVLIIKWKRKREKMELIVRRLYFDFIFFHYLFQSMCAFMNWEFLLMYKGICHN